MVPIPPAACPAVAPVPWHLPIGVSIGLLSLVAILQTIFRPNMGRKEKAVFAVVFGLLFYTELRSIKWDQTQHYREQSFDLCQQLHGFDQIHDTLTDAISAGQAQFAVTDGQVNGVLKTTNGVAQTANHNLRTSNEIWNATTGGNSFPVVDAVGYPGPEEDFVVQTHGKYPLHDVQIQIVDSDAMTNGLRALTRAPTPSEVYRLGRRDFPIGYLIPNQTRVILYSETAFAAKGRYQIFSSARNGGWLEELRLVRLDNGEIVSALRVFANGMENNHPLLVSVGDHFPRRPDGSIDWN